MRETPSQIEKLKKEQRSLMQHIYEKKNGFQQFSHQLEKFHARFRTMVSRESCELTENDNLEEMARHLAMQVTFLEKFPHDVRTKFHLLLQSSSTPSETHPTNKVKLFAALFSEEKYFEIIGKVNVPFNQTFIDNITLIEFL